MKWFRKRWVAVAALSTVALAAELGEWVQHLRFDAVLQTVFFRPMQLPSGVVDGRRPPAETVVALARLIAAQPRNAELRRLRASEAELALDFATAESDWREYAALASDRAAGDLALADFYHRRLRPLDEIRVLDAAAGRPTVGADVVKPPEEQRSWQAFTRIIALVAAQALPDTVANDQYRAWIARYPRDPRPRKQFLHFLLQRGQYTLAGREITVYERAFPADEVTPVVEEAALTLRRGTPSQALAVYDRAFRPLMPQPLFAAWFQLLEQQGRLRDFVASARAAAQQHPEDLGPAARLFYYYRERRNLAAARRALIEYRIRKKQWQPEELSTLATLLGEAQEHNEAARCWYALYSLPGADAGARGQALAGLAGILLTAPEQAVRFGTGELSYYKDIGTMDHYPGFLNGILSLVLNSTQPGYQYKREDQAAWAYFHRARAAELVDLLEKQAPASPRVPELRAAVIQTYLDYNRTDAVLSAANRFLKLYPRSSKRTDVALALADAYARQDRPAAEFAIYEQLLKEFASSMNGLPIGEGGTAPPPVPGIIYGEPPPWIPRAPETQKQPRSQEYARVLDRYLARLVAMQRIPEALELYRRQIDQNPNDPGLYERLAAFLEQNHLGDQVEQVYRRALAQFQNATWSDKLARWYLRMNRGAEFARLTRQVADTFSGSELERYFREVVPKESLDASLYLQLNLYAHEHFPNDIVFVKNLLIAYTRKETADPAAYSKLLRRYWFYDDEIRAWLFEALERTGKLAGELAAAQAPSNPAAQRFYAEGQAWRSHFEDAAPAMREVALAFPGNTDLVGRASDLYRSLGAYNPANTNTAASLAELKVRAVPRDTQALARVGDILADRDWLTRASPWWNRIATVEPGKPEGYLEAATIYWDYFRYDDALHLLAEGRAKLKDPTLYAYEAGAIYENKHDYPVAAAEYMKEAVAKENTRSEGRLLELAKMPAHRKLVEQAITAAAAAPHAPAGAIYLRAALLEDQGRRSEEAAFLTSVARGSDSPAMLVWVRQTASRVGLDAVGRFALRREAEVTKDPLERNRLRLELAHDYETRKDVAAARRVIEEVYRESPEILGVVRATVDFYWRNRMPRDAISTLERAAASANPALRAQFTLEAARKSTEAGEYAQARQLLAPLLQAEPYNAQYLAAMADTWARAGDDRGLRDFYLARIKGMKAASLSPSEREERVAGLRRGLIPALTRLGEFPEALDEYTEIINRYAEDEGLIKEAAGYAIEHRLQDRITAYYAKAAADSPRDSRWPIVLARLDTHFEDFSGAIAAYRQASAIRPDRTDLLLARATLEERLMRFAEASATYRRVYDLSYRNAHWLEKVAELSARQGRADEAEKLLREALLSGRPERPEYLFHIAATLESWGMVDRALQYAQRGMDLGGAQDIEVYAEVMARARHYQTAWTRLLRYGRIPSSLARTVNTYYTPEEKTAFAAFLETQRASVPLGSLIAVARDAGLKDREAAWEYELASRPADVTNRYSSPVNILVRLQTERLRFTELATQLETLARANPAQAGAWIPDAARALEEAGDIAGAVRLIGSAADLQRNPLDLRALAHSDPSQLLALIRGAHADQLRDAAADAALASGDSRLAFDAVAARGRGMTPLWTESYTALTAVYYARTAPDVNGVFEHLLGPMKIGLRLGRPVDRTVQLAGSEWFYYGSRYGEYLAARGDARSADYLPALAEANPGNPVAYMELGDSYGERAQNARALTNYAHATGLDPNLGPAHDRAALILFGEGKCDAALAEWRAALAAFEHEQGQPNLRQEFWTEAPEALDHLGTRKLFGDVRPEIVSLLRAYVARHRWYRTTPLFRAVVENSGLPLALEAVAGSQDARWILEELSRAFWVPAAAKPEIVRKLISLVHNDEEIARYRLQLAGALLNAGDARAAEAELAAIEPAPNGRQAVELEIRIAAKTGNLARLIGKWRGTPAEAPGAYELRKAASALRYEGDARSANLLLEYLYTRDLNRGNFEAANFLGLAEVYLNSGDAAAAIATLRRMPLVAGEPFDSLVPAADLLEKFGKNAEAEQFLEARVKAVPWDFAARLRLARARKSPDELRTIAANSAAPYAVRGGAASALSELHAPAAGLTGELTLLAGGTVPPSAAARPYYFQARIAAARQAHDPKTRLDLLLDAFAIQPGNDLRLDVFRAAAAAQRDRLALVAIEPLLCCAEMDPRVRIELSAIRQRFGDYQEAKYELQRIDRDRLTPAERNEVDKRLAALDRLVRLEHENRGRRPVITGTGIGQQNLVRPRGQS